MNALRIFPDKHNGADVEAPEWSTRYKYIYLHGQAEDESGFDCCNMDYLPVFAGVYPAKVYTGERTVPALLYYVPNGRMQSGLIVYANDTQGRKEAEQWMLDEQIR